MEHIHGVDVSWMTHGNPKDKSTKITTRQRSLSQLSREPPAPSPRSGSPLPSPPVAHLTHSESAPPTPTPIPAKQATPVHPGLSRSVSEEKRLPAVTAAPTGPTTPQRRGSWFSNISSKFSSGIAGNGGGQSPPQANTSSPKLAELSVPKANPVKNAVLQHASKYEGEGPYTPAPPRSSQAGILHVFRRLSSSNGSLSPNVKPHNHGLVERRVLNVDRHRERCNISGLHQAKLRRVAFCVDVEIAPMPKYQDDESGEKKLSDKADKDQKRKIKEKGEGDALKTPKAVETLKDENGDKKSTGEEASKVPFKEDTADGGQVPNGSNESMTESKEATNPDGLSDKSAAEAKKKEKKKKSEEERKARKERKRKQAEANGTIPMEIYVDSDASSTGSIPRPSTPKATQAGPTINPVRIYRRCCQLRETPILKKITEQLSDPANSSPDEPGMIEKLDLTGYWMQLGDLVTLGDYLAVVPIREVILENCGLGDEGLRVILAGLLAARKVAIGKKRKTQTEPDGLAPQGGVVERLVLKNNKAGPEGWKHICLFIYLCRTLKNLDLSGIPMPRSSTVPGGHPNGGSAAKGARQDQDLCQLLSCSLGERLGGPTLSLLNLGQVGLSTAQLGSVIDGVIKCGVKRLGLAHNDIDAEGLNHVARFLASGLCEGLDLGGNDLRDRLAILADSLQIKNCPLWALSLADCNLTPSSLCKMMPKLVKLAHFRFIDLSHNHELFSSNPSAVSLLRRYLPKMACLKRIHLADCSLTPEQVIALTEIIPEIPGLAHISFLENPALVQLTTGTSTDDSTEEAFALFASFLAASRISTSLVAVDIEVPSEQSSDLVKAMAKQVVAYCLRNMERLPAAELTISSHEPGAQAEPEYPDVLQRLIGHDVMDPPEMDEDVDAAPDDDYVIGGTGVVKALACCLKNRGDESRRQSGEFIRDVESGIPHPRPGLVPTGKAKETSKHLLQSARKIRHRLQPAINKAKTVSNDGTHAYHRLIFLDNTLNGIIKRFEEEFPDTRESIDSGIALPTQDDVNGDTKADAAAAPQWATTVVSPDHDLLSPPTAISDNEDDVPEDGHLQIRSPLVRSDSTISITSKALADEEGRVLRAGHIFRSGIVRPEHYPLLSGVEMVGADPNHVRLLHELLDEMGGYDADGVLAQEVKEKGVVKVFQEHREAILQNLRDADPAHWEIFVESQEMARANAQVGDLAGVPTAEKKGDEVAVGE
ncbi:hypothetical protein B0H63DRAFT_222795 [Podospora didyma]|uniref:Cell wall biogenesis protein Mhp1 n=1 Tax=Podospora didyma TaxID=330526 RepID=A0AAE0KKG4_9PEZI|nr:hypothetical protein B0H63DRAFT_222795 [Podospora didyma]